MFRRDFIKTLGASFVMGNIIQEVQASPLLFKKNIKPIEGSWFEFQHHSLIEGKYWNPALESFTAEQWGDKIKEIAECGIRYLVLLDTAIYGKSFYPSHILPKHQLGCDDPLETVLSAADKYGIRFFISNGFYGEWTNPAFLMKDEATHKLRLKAMNEIAEKYAHHKSFYGWYYPNETGINGYYDDIFINYVNNCSKEAYKLTPKAKTLIAPYGTRNVIADEKYLKQLDLLNVDFIAYQDEVGVEKTKVEESAIFFERLFNMHKKASKARIWADVEMFRFEGKVYQSPLLPASPDRIIQQLEAISPYVEKIFIYQYTGLINKPGSKSYAGTKESETLYTELSKKGLLRT